MRFEYFGIKSLRVFSANYYVLYSSMYKMFDQTSTRVYNGGMQWKEKNCGKYYFEQ